MDTKSGIQEACEALGGQEHLAAAIKRATGASVTQQAVSLWVKQGYAPLGRVPLIAKLTGVEAAKLCSPRVLATVIGD